MFTFEAAPFFPSPALKAWASDTFIRNGAELENQDHEHLKDANIGFLWTTVANSRHMMTIAGQAELPKFQGGKWSKRRQEQQIEQWFGSLPDFLITLDANYASQCDDASFCALVEHELYHCGQERDEFGGPKFTGMGTPKYGIRGHDVEEFVGIVRRYGVGAGGGQTLALIEAAQAKPQIARAKITAACGSCAALIG
jgi:hypothetical protein